MNSGLFKLLAYYLKIFKSFHRLLTFKLFQEWEESAYSDRVLDWQSKPKDNQTLFLKNLLLR